MNKRRMIGVMAFAFTVMMLMSAVTVMAAPPLPMTRQGTVYLDGTAVGDGMEISAWADGVKYVMNDTYNGDGTYKLNVPGDDPDVTTEKDGASDGETVVYWMFDGTNWYIANEVSSFTSGDDSILDLNFASGTQPYMAKLWELVPAPSSGNDFLWIAAPSNWDPSAYSLENNNGWSLGLTTTNCVYKSNTAGTWSAWYVDLGGDVMGAADEMKLVWTDPTGVVAGGNAVVIDRVEYGGQTTEPDNTIMVDASAPGTDQALLRAGTVSAPTDTENCANDFSVVAADYPLLWTAQPVYNLWVEKDTTNGDAILHWDDAGSPPGGYNIYYATNPNAAWPWSTLATGVSGTSYTHTGALSDANNYFYIVRSTDGSTEGGNSSIAYVVKVDMVNNADKSDFNWAAVPDVIYATARDLNGDGALTASDIVIDIEGGTGDGTNTKIDSIAYWDATQQTIGGSFYYVVDPFAGNGWKGGADFTITPGMSIRVQTTSSFTWVINGTDSGSNGYSLVNNADKSDFNWISVPVTLKDMNGDGAITASDIVIQIEGGTGDGTNTKIDSIAYWDATQQTIGGSFYYVVDPFAGNGWKGGADFTITPGMTVRVQTTSSFTWTPVIVQNEVTQ